MSLAEKFKSVQPRDTGLPCGVFKIMELMTKDDKNALNSVLFNTTSIRVSNSKIHQILVDEGFEIAPYAIAQHRRKQCRCFVGKNVMYKETK